MIQINYIFPIYDFYLMKILKSGYMKDLTVHKLLAVF